MSSLAVSQLGLRHEGADLLRAVSLTAPAGKITAVLGPAGSGKTALLRAVAGLDAPHAGSIRIGDQVVFDAANRIVVRPERRGVGFLFQSGALWRHLTVAENLGFCLRLRRDKANAAARVEQTLAEVGIADLASRRPPELSTAERQRVALARALVGRPRLLLLDDPLAGIAEDVRAEFRLWLRQAIAKTGLTALIATRERTDAFALADHIVLLNAGSVEQAGVAAELYNAPATPFAAALLGASNRIEGTLVEQAGSRAVIDVMGTRLGGTARTRAAVGQKVTGMIRTERVLLGGGPGANRLGMTLVAQTYLGERWEVTFVKEALTVRAHTSAPLRHEFYHVEFPPDALWIY
jgi:iron(III) transport system ATP-binding protein